MTRETHTWVRPDKQEPNELLKLDPYKLVGTALGKYEVLEFVDVGGLGVVYRGQHSVTTAIVGLKILKPEYAYKHSEMVEAFFEEAKKTVNLHHPNIILVTDADISSDGLPFLVMEWLAGATLDDELRTNGVMSAQRVANLLGQICEALEYAHNQGIIHRDLIPGNVMVVRDYKGEELVKILDFGIAKAMGSTADGKVSRQIGTPYYASPEQFTLGGRIDHRADIYSLGVMTFQLLTGELPFKAESVERMIHHHLESPPVSPWEIRPEIPQAVGEVVVKALAKRPEDRYQSALEFARAFRRAVNIETGRVALRCLNSETHAPIAGAAIYLDGIYKGSSDEGGYWTATGLSPGDHLIAIDCLYHEGWTARVTVESRAETALIAELRKVASGSLTIKTDVPGAEVSIAGTVIGTTDAAGILHASNLPAGQVLLRITHPKRLPLSKEVEVLSGQAVQVEEALTPRPRRIPFHKIRAKLRAVLLVPLRSIKSRRRDVSAAAKPRLDLSTFKLRQVRILAPLVAVLFIIVVLIGFYIAPGRQTNPTVPQGEPIEKDFALRLNPSLGDLPLGVVMEGSAIEILESKESWQRIEILQWQGSPLAANSGWINLDFPMLHVPEGMVLIPGGAFQMGRDGAETDEREQPVHTIVVSPFLMDKFEVTCGDYRRFVLETGYAPAMGWPNSKCPEDQAEWPVTGVSWLDATAFAKWAGKRLPTEEEWEFTARGPDGRLYPWGNDWDATAANADHPSGELAPVGSYSTGVSPVDVFDLCGNVWEWTASEFRTYPGGAIKEDALAPVLRQRLRAIRGGAYQYPPEEVTATRRYGVAESGDNYARLVLGFRCAKDITLPGDVELIEIQGTESGQGNATLGGSPIRYGRMKGTVKPEYPLAARQAGVSGAVDVRVAVDENGGVTSVETLSGPEPLRKSVVEAVGQLKFEASTQRGRPVEVSRRLRGNFNLRPLPLRRQELLGRAILQADPPHRARSMTGQVSVEIVVDEQGAVITATALSGPRGLQSMATELARQWKFQPTHLDGRPVPVTGILVFDF